MTGSTVGQGTATPAWLVQGEVALCPCGCIGKRKKGSLGGEAAKAHDRAEAERIAKGGLAALGLPDAATELKAE